MIYPSKNSITSDDSPVRLSAQEGTECQQYAIGKLNAQAGRKKKVSQCSWNWPIVRIFRCDSISCFGYVSQ